MDWGKLSFRLQAELIRGLYRLSGLRPSSRPFLSGDGYRRLCPHRFESGREGHFKPDRVAAGQRVFVESWLLEAFFDGPGRRIPAPFVLVSCNGDVNVTPDLAARKPDQARRWFAQNLQVPRSEWPALGVEPLPIGLENRRLFVNGTVGDFRRLQRRIKNGQKPGESGPDRILYGFAAENNQAERGPALAALKTCAWATPLQGRPYARLYRKRLMEQAFVASPPGNGEDCHRTWEALYLGVIPVLKKSPLTEWAREEGLPVIAVKSWDEVALGPQALKSRLPKGPLRFDHPLLDLNTWARRFEAAGQELARG